jgi:hypothetical protein
MRQIAHPHNPNMTLSAPTRWLWVVALVAALAVATIGAVALIDDGSETATFSSPAQVSGQPQPGTVRYDGGPNEGTAGLSVSRPQPGIVRYDGGPNEGMAGVRSGAGTVGGSLSQPGASISDLRTGPSTPVASVSAGASTSRYDGGPNEGSAVIHVGGPR